MFPPPTPPRPHPTSVHFLSKKMKRKTKKMPKQSKTNKAHPTPPKQSDLCLPTTPGHKPHPGM